MPNEGKDQYTIRKLPRSSGIEENSEGLGKVLKSIVTWCRKPGTDGVWLGTYFIRISALWIARYAFDKVGVFDRLQSLRVAPHFPLTPGLPLISGFKDHLTLFPPHEYPCNLILSPDEKLPTLSYLAQQETEVPLGFKRLVDYVHRVATDAGKTIPRIVWEDTRTSSLYDITDAMVLHSSHRSVLLLHPSLGCNVLKVSDQETILSEYEISSMLRGCPWVRQTVPESYGKVSCGNGLEFQGLLLVGIYPSTLTSSHVDEDEDLHRVCQQLLQACDAIHSRGVLHRDLKPSNVLVSENGAIIINDLDSAVALNSSAEQRMQLAGSEAFRSPLQSRGKPFRRADDVLSIGLTVARLLGYHANSSCRGRCHGILRLVDSSSRAPEEFKERVCEALQDDAQLWQTLLGD